MEFYLFYIHEGFYLFYTHEAFDQNLCSSKRKLVGDLAFEVIMSGNYSMDPIVMRKGTVQVPYCSEKKDIKGYEVAMF